MQRFSLPPLRGGSYYGHYLKSRHRQLGGGTSTGFWQGFVPGPLPLSICLKIPKKSDEISWKSGKFSSKFRDLRRKSSKSCKICKILKKIEKFWYLRFLVWSVSCRSRQALSNEYLIAKIRFDTAENGPSKVWGGRVLSVRHLKIGGFSKSHNCWIACRFSI